MEPEASNSRARLASRPVTEGSRQTQAGRSSRAAVGVGVLLLLEVVLWLAVFGVAGLFREGPNGKGMATDFAVFSGAAEALKHGENPYDYHTLYRWERFLLRSQGLPVTSNELNVRAGNPPLFYWALEPLTAVPFQRAALAWVAAMYLASLLGFILTLRYLKWKSWLVPTAVFMLMPQVVTGAVYGNVHGPVLAAIAASLLLVNRYPFAAGAVASLGWLKPQLAFPLLFVILLFHSSRRRAAVAGFVSATGLLLVLSVATTGPRRLGDWLAGINNWSHGIAREPNIASLSGLYAGWTTRGVQLAIATALLLGALAVTVLAWRRLAPGDTVPVEALGWLWAIWFLVAPFAHFPDEILLTAPVLAFLGPDGRYLGQRSRMTLLYLIFFSLILFPSPLVSLSVVAAAVILWRDGWGSRTVRGERLLRDSQLV